jgi:hypothetical protein
MTPSTVTCVIAMIFLNGFSPASWLRTPRTNKKEACPEGQAAAGMGGSLWTAESPIASLPQLADLMPVYSPGVKTSRDFALVGIEVTTKG